MTPLDSHIARALQTHGIGATDAQRARCVRWAEEAARHGKRANLIGTRDPARIAEELVADSLQLIPLIPDGPAHIVDVGSGAGVPGLILAAVFEAHITLIEPRKKRAMFLRHAVRSMQIAERCTILAARLEDVPDTALPDAPKIWVSRAVFAPPQWLQAAAEHAQPNDQCVVWQNGHATATHPEWTMCRHKPYTISNDKQRTIAIYRRKTQISAAS